MFENKVFEGIHYSRFVASWINSGAYKLCRRKVFGREFKEWLESLIINGKTIPNDIIQEICNYAENGKFELEENVRNYIKEKESF